MPSDMGEMFATQRAGRKALREALGMPCPRCQAKRPKAQPSILLPNQACKVDGYIDPRPHTTVEQRNACYAAAGVDLVELATPEPPFVEIDYAGRDQRCIYRFYGRGVWRVRRDAAWHPINGLNVPADVLEIAAAQCHGHDDLERAEGEIEDRAREG